MIVISKIFIVVIVSVVIAQGLKIFLNLGGNKKRLELSDLIVTGGMPSTHSALVSSLFAILLFETGLSAWTAIAFVVFFIVISDSMGVRRTVGEEARLVNKIIKLEHLKIHHLRYSSGHTPIQVFWGMVIGFFIAISIWLM